MKYIVLPIAMSLKNNKMAYSKDIVDDSQLTTNSSELIGQGFIRPLTEEELKDYKKNSNVEDVEPELSEEEKEASLKKKEEDDAALKLKEEEAAALKLKEEEEAANQKKIEEDKNPQTPISAKDAAKDSITKK